MIRGVFFDHGGTLVHMPTDEASLGGILRDLGYDFSPTVLSKAAARFGEHWEARYSSLPRGRRWTFDIRRDCDRASLADLGLGEALEVVTSQVTKRWEGAEGAELYDDALATLEALRAMDLRMGVVSQRLQTTPEFLPRLEALGVGRYFPVVVTSEEAGFDKPDPRLYLWAAAKMGMRPSELCHVGDTYAFDVVGAREAGIKPILIDREGRDEHGDCVVVGSLTEVPAIVKHLA